MGLLASEVDAAAIPALALALALALAAVEDCRGRFLRDRGGAPLLFLVLEGGDNGDDGAPRFVDRRAPLFRLFLAAAASGGGSMSMSMPMKASASDDAFVCF